MTPPSERVPGMQAAQPAATLTGTASPEAVFLGTGPLRGQQRVIVIGASAGGVEAVRELLSSLPAQLPAAVLVVLHIPAHSRSYLPEIFNRAGALPAAHAEDGEILCAGRVYVAPPDHHLLLEGHKVRVSKGPKENRFRPSVDALFRSAAYTYGPRAVGVVLSGTLDDGTSGLWTVARLGGVTLVQRPQEAGYEEMPLNAIRQVQVDAVQPVAELAASLVRLAAEASATAPLPETSVPTTSLPEAILPTAVDAPTTEGALQRLKIEIQIAGEGNGFELGVMNLGTPTPLTCPECHGALLQIVEGTLIRYRCHTGHAYSPAALLQEVTESVEAAFWQTLRVLEERALLLGQVSLGLQNNAPHQAQQFLTLSNEAKTRGAALRQVMFDPPLPSALLED